MNRTPASHAAPRREDQFRAGGPGRPQPPAGRAHGRPSATSRRCWTWPKPQRDAAPKPGEGRTAFLWEILASVTAVDVAAGRAIEPHLDASAILAQAAGQAALEGWDCPDFDGVHFDGAWGVFAAEAAGLRLEAKPADGCFLLQGSKPWCSLAAQLDHAVVTAHLDDGGRAAFAVDLHAHGVGFADPEWTSRGLRGNPQRHRALRRRSGRAPRRRRLVLPPARLRLGRHGRGRLLAGRRRRGGPRLQGLPAHGGRRRTRTGPARTRPPRRDRPHARRPDRVPGPDRRTDRRRGTLGRRRVERGPAGPRQRCRRRRTHPDAGQPEPRPRPRSPSTRSTESGWPTSPCTSASTTPCATTPSWVP